jgi:hypothetical protein
MTASESLLGIISYLTQRHGGELIDKGIIDISSSSLFDDDPQSALANVADLTSPSSFCSQNGSVQWVCWDFRALRVRLTNYTVWSADLKSWAIQGSVDGENWTEIDRQTDSQAFKSRSRRSDGRMASFAVTRSAEFRFVRLTQSESHKRTGGLVLHAVAFFGTLLE